VQEFEDIRQVGNARLRVRVVRVESTRRVFLDVREYITSPEFEGWTRKGIRISAESFALLLEQTKPIMDALEADHAAAR
jgi:hypothetical protein